MACKSPFVLPPENLSRINQRPNIRHCYRDVIGRSGSPRLRCPQQWLQKPIQEPNNKAKDPRQDIEWVGGMRSGILLLHICRLPLMCAFDKWVDNVNVISWQPYYGIMRPHIEDILVPCDCTWVCVCRWVFAGDNPRLLSPIKISFCSPWDGQRQPKAMKRKHDQGARFGFKFRLVGSLVWIDKFINPKQSQGNSNTLKAMYYTRYLDLFISRIY